MLLCSSFLFSRKCFYWTLFFYYHSLVVLYHNNAQEFDNKSFGFNPSPAKRKLIRRNAYPRTSRRLREITDKFDVLHGQLLGKRVQRFFHLFILSTTSEKLFIPYKASAAVQALKVCPVRPRVLSRYVQFGQESCPDGEYLHSERLWMLEKCLQVSILLPLPSHKPHTFPKTHKKKKSWGINLLEKLRAADES